jgi:hypothetical protein
MKLEFTETIGQQVFRVDDVSDEAPMAQMQFFNEFAGLPYERRKRAARIGLAMALRELLRSDEALEPESDQERDRR